ncbi:translation machinery-associated protein 16-like [Panulirus ornatus]|uniref:translation machinery-associated protein 16-like n=1 Tax=Panulirus ornatus TaxID=150431 RepID=UPI003A84EEA8
MGKPTLADLKNSQKKIHPRSRKAKQLSKRYNRELKLKKRRGENNIKLQFLGDKLIWFKENMTQGKEQLTHKDILELIQKYIDRNLEELEQINIKHRIGGRASRQHASREDHIRITYEREMNQFTSCGFETVDFLNMKSMNVFKSWSGELRYIPNFKLRKFTKQFLESGVMGPKESTLPQDAESDEEMDNGDIDSHTSNESEGEFPEEIV